MRPVFAAVAVFPAAITVTSHQSTGRAMKIDDRIAAVRVTDPQLAPVGSHVVFVRTTTDLKTGERNADIWTVPADGSAAPKELIVASKSDNTPRLSPDGGTLAFVSMRDGAPQVFVADPKG